MKLAIISGGSRGLGASLCTAYLDLGWRLVEFSRNGASDFSIKLDLADPEQAGAIFADSFSRLAANEYEEIVAINNAATLAPIGPVVRMAAADIKANLKVNFVSQILFIHYFVRSFQEHRCRKTVVNISSGAALKGYAGWSLYCASKAGMENFVRSLAIEQSGERHPIVALSVDPHIIDTEMQAAIRASRLEDFPSRERFVGFKENGMLRSPADVAATIVRIVAQRPAGGGRLSVAEALDRCEP